jgi:hypothetical protein
MEKIMGQIEQDILYGDDDQTPPGAAPPGLQVSPTGSITRGPKVAKGGVVPPSGPGPLSSVVNLLKKQAGPLPVWGWGALAVGTATVVTAGFMLTRNRY